LSIDDNQENKKDQPLKQLLSLPLVFLICFVLFYFILFYFILF